MWFEQFARRSQACKVHSPINYSRKLRALKADMQMRGVATRRQFHAALKSLTMVSTVEWKLTRVASFFHIQLPFKSNKFRFGVHSGRECRIDTSKIKTSSTHRKSQPRSASDLKPSIDWSRKRLRLWLFRVCNFLGDMCSAKSGFSTFTGRDDALHRTISKTPFTVKVAFFHCSN